jgi:hypothetical protein
MAAKKIPIEIDISTTEGQKRIKDLNKELAATDKALDDVGSAGKQMAEAMNRAADDAIAEIDATRQAVDALERALGPDFTGDTTEVVANLKRVGLTAQDVERDAEDLAAAIKRADDVKVHAVKQGFDDIGKAVRDVDVDTGRTKSTMANFAANSAEELPGISNALGPVVTGLGQLVEGAAEGETNIKQLVTAGAGFAAFGFILSQVKGHFDKIEAVKAWKTDEVDDYKSALEDTDTVLQGIIEKLKEDKNIGVMLFGDEETDITGKLAQIGLSVEDFALLVEGGETKLREWGTAMKDAGVDADAVDLIMLSAGQQAEALDGALAGAEATAKVFGMSAEDAATHAARLADEEKRVHDESKNTQRGLENVNEELLETERDANRAEIALSDLRGEMSNREGFLNIQAGFEQVQTLGAEAWLAVATGAADAEAKARDYELAQIGLKDEIIAYAEEVGNVPPEKLTTILTAIDKGELEWAEAQIELLTRPRSIYTNIVVNGRGELGPVQSGARAAGGPVAAGGTYLVGEEGPELITPTRAGFVHDAGSTAGMVGTGSSLGGGGVTLVIQGDIYGVPKDEFWRAAAVQIQRIQRESQ